MIALEELAAMNKRLDLIIDNSDVLEERTMASIVKQNVMQMLKSLSLIPDAQFKELCAQQEELEKENSNDK